MSWISYNIPIKKIATEDITCYKLFRRDSIIWKKTNSQKIIEKLISICTVYTYIPYKENPKVNLTYLKTSVWFWDDFYNYRINEGYHSYETLDRVKKDTTFCDKDRRFIVKCIIPKGSEYYVNGDHEIVSSSIIVTDKIVE